jgi:peptidoglycan/xylan/chitin deacetylase (PgdA/CDA1 family)
VTVMRAFGLIYHDVVDRDAEASGRSGVGPDLYKITWERFVEQLDRIEEKVGMLPAVADDLLAGRGAAPSWALTFDDGGASALPVGEELLRRSWRGHFFITSGSIGHPGFVDADAIRELDRMGHIVGSHSMTHPDRMASLPADKLLREWSQSVDILAQVLGKDVLTASVPGGYYRKSVAVAAAQAGVTTLFTSEPVRSAHLVDGCLVVGRYSIRRDTSADDAARAVAGETASWLPAYVGWNARKFAKQLAGKRYEPVRRKLLALRSSNPDRR